MEWLNPTYLWTLAAAPLAAVVFLWAAWKRRQALQRFAGRPVVERLLATVRSRRRGLRATLVTISILLMAMALAGPRFGKNTREVSREGVDLVIALDVSRSMYARDIAPSRLERAKNEIKQMLDELSGSRVSLVVFAGDAFIQCPLTSDYSALRLFLDAAEPSMIPTQGTDFSAALSKAMDAFETASSDVQTDPRSRAVLFVSDGENHGGNLQETVEKAREAGITLFAAGVGTGEGGPIPLYEDGQRTGYKRDRSGQIVQTRLHESSLKTLAANGAYFRIARTSSSLQQVIPALRQLQTTSLGTETFEEYTERFQWPLALALLLLLLERLVHYGPRRAQSTPYEEAAA